MYIRSCLLLTKGHPHLACSRVLGPTKHIHMCEGAMQGNRLCPDGALRACLHLRRHIHVPLYGIRDWMPVYNSSSVWSVSFILCFSFTWPFQPWHQAGTRAGIPNPTSNLRSESKKERLVSISADRNTTRSHIPVLYVHLRTTYHVVIALYASSRYRCQKAQGSNSSPIAKRI